MAKISVHDIRGLCDAGVFRVTVEGSDAFIARGGRIPAPMQSLKN